MKKQILIIHTGGTIAMTSSESGGIRPAEVHPLSDVMDTIKPLANLTIEEMMKRPSPHMTPVHMNELAKEIKRVATKYDGIVITHGTDTLEETAYALDLLLNVSCPVIMTGAMRSANELGADGPYNLYAAVQVAISDEATHKGVLVVMNDEIHTAKNVTKTDTHNLATFKSPNYGPIGLVTKNHVTFHHTLTRRDVYPGAHLTGNVLLLKAFSGMDETVIEALLTTKPDGLIIEAFGQGNVPPKVATALQKVIEGDIPVILVSRCYQGVVQPAYSYEGGGKTLQEMGVIFTNGLTGPKARLKLMACLSLTTDPLTLQQWFYF